MDFSLKNISCSTPLDLKTDNQTKVYRKIKKLVDEEGYCLVSVKDFTFEYIMHLKEKLRRKFKECFSETDEKHFNGLSKLQSIPKEAVQIQSSSGMHALFSTLLESAEIFNAFDIPQVVARGEYQHYKGLNVFGMGYVGLLTLTYQTLADGVGVPEGTLLIYDSKKGASLLAPNLVKSDIKTMWIGLRFTFWKDDIFDPKTRNALYLTGGFGLYVPTDRPRKILPDRVALLNNNIVRQTCLAKESWKLPVDQIVKEAERTLVLGQPFPSQLVWNKEKKRIQFQYSQKASRCPHPDCKMNDKVYVNIKLHMSSKHSNACQTTMHQTERNNKKSFDREMDERKDRVPNVPTKRSFDQNDTNRKKHCILNQKKEVKFDLPRKTTSINREPFSNVCDNRRRKRLSLNKRVYSRSTTEHDELHEALKEMTSLSSPISPLAPEDQEEMASFSQPTSPSYEDDNEELEADLLHTTVDFRDLYDATITWRNNLNEKDDNSSSLQSEIFCENLKELPSEKEQQNKSQTKWANMYKGEWNLIPIDQDFFPERKSFSTWINKGNNVSPERNPTQEPDSFIAEILQSPVDNNQIAMELDRLDSVLRQTRMDLETKDEEEEVTTKNNIDILDPYRCVLDNHSYSEDRDFDAEKYRLTIAPMEFEKCPKQMNLEYDRFITLTKIDDKNDVAIYKRHYLSWNKNQYLKDYIFCNMAGFKDISPDIMVNDDKYRKLRCYMKTKTENAAYEIRGARTVIEAVKIFYHGTEEIKNKTKKKEIKTVRPNRKWCFILADSNEALNSVTEGKVYDVKRIPFHSVEHNQHHLVYPDWRYPNYEAPDYFYLPFQEEPKLSRGVRSVVSIPSQKEDKIKMLSDFLYNEFQRKFNHHPDKDRCVILALLLYNELDRLPLKNVHVSMPPTIDDLIKEHQEARASVLKLVLDIILDPSSQLKNMGKVKSVSLKQLVMMKMISKETTNIQDMYKAIDYITISDIFLLGIIVQTQHFINGLRLCEDH